MVVIMVVVVQKCGFDELLLGYFVAQLIIFNVSNVSSLCSISILASSPTDIVGVRSALPVGHGYLVELLLSRTDGPSIVLRGELIRMHFFRLYSNNNII